MYILGIWVILQEFSGTLFQWVKLQDKKIQFLFARVFKIKYHCFAVES